MEIVEKVKRKIRITLRKIPNRWLRNVSGVIHVGANVRARERTL
jgi:hypothetical protein